MDQVISETVREHAYWQAYDFAQQYHILPSNKEEAMPVLRKCVTVVYPFDGIFKYKVCCVKTLRICN